MSVNLWLFDKLPKTTQVKAGCFVLFTAIYQNLCNRKLSAFAFTFPSVCLYFSFALWNPLLYFGERKIEREGGRERASERILKMNGSEVYGGLEAQYIGKHHRHEPRENQCTSELVKHIKAPVHLVSFLSAVRSDVHTGFFGVSFWNECRWWLISLPFFDDEDSWEFFILLSLEISVNRVGFEGFFFPLRCFSFWV